MQRSAYAFILAAFVLLGGCRSAESPSVVTPSPEPQPASSAAEAPATASASDPNDHRPLLICFGDSLTAGYGAETGKSYPDFLQADLDAKGFPYRVVNEGVSGATSKDGVVQLPSIVAMKPAVVVVEFGGNDGLRGLPIRDLRANLDIMVGTLKSAGAKVVVAGISLPPDYGPDYISQLNASYPLVAKKYNVPLLPFLLQGVFGVEGMMQQDRTHATAKGNEVVAKNVLPLVLPLLKK
jgi:acyl-CoA thioesterase-1